MEGSKYMRNMETWEFVILHYINLAGIYLKQINKHMPHLGLFKSHCTPADCTDELFSYSVCHIQYILCRPDTKSTEHFTILFKLGFKTEQLNLTWSEYISVKTCSKARFGLIVEAFTLKPVDFAGEKKTTTKHQNYFGLPLT